jgi:hypothetical protein
MKNHLVSTTGGAPRHGIAESRERPAHLCAKCKTPMGKSAIPCPNEPKGTR